MKRKHIGVLRNNFAANLKNARRLAGLTQARLAEIVGMHITAVQNFERRINSPTLDSLEALAAGLDLPAAVMIAPPAEALPLMSGLLPTGQPPKVPKRSSRGRVV